MKHKFSILAIVLIVALLSTTFTAFASSLPLRVVVNGDKVNFPDAEPFIDENLRTLVPVRFVSEALGAKVAWDGKNKKATITYNHKKMTITIGKKSYVLDGKTKQMDTAAVFKEERTFVPLRFVSEGLGATVKWDAAVKTAYISTLVKPEEPSTETKVADVHGFKITYSEMGPNLDPTYVSNSQLYVTEYESEGKGSMLFEISISFIMQGADPAKATDEAEDILRQKVESSTVDSIMKYVRTKTKREDILKYKFFEGEKYDFDVVSRGMDDIGIGVYMK